MIDNFSDLALQPKLLETLSQLGFIEPTEIQKECIPALLEGRDVVGIAQTGTGKTAAFGLPILNDLSNEPEVQAIILSPTRELALQTSRAIEEFASGMSGTQTVCVYGGAPYRPQISALRAGAQVVVGTPGRVIDLIEKDELKLDQARYFILDEADEMLKMGFFEDVETIAAQIPENSLRALFSATMPPAITRLSEQYLRDPFRIEVTPQASTVDTIEQTYAVVPYKFKIQALGRVLATTPAEATIVFVRTRMDAEEVATEIMNRGFKAAALSGDVAQAERERIVNRLRSGTLDVLVATDVAARGLDVERVGLVVNFDVPRETSAYVHRIGRTGRAGRTGTALTFFTPREQSQLREIERLTETTLQEVTVPTPRQVQEHLARKRLENLPERIEQGGLEPYLEMLDDFTWENHLDPQHAAAALLALAVDAGVQGHSQIRRRGNETPRVRREENVDPEGNFISAIFEVGRDRPKTKRHSSGRRHRASGRRYRIEVGKRDGIRPGSIVGAITNEGGIRGEQVGHIEIYPSFSLVEIPDGLSPQAARRISKARLQGRALRIREDQGPRDKRGGRD